MTTTTQIRSQPSPEDLMPPMTYGDFQKALELVASGRTHRNMIPFLVSALQQQAPFLSGQMLMFEILCSASCLSDLPKKPLHS